jgi:hypothetical protein
MAIKDSLSSAFIPINSKDVRKTKTEMGCQWFQFNLDLDNFCYWRKHLRSIGEVHPWAFKHRSLESLFYPFIYLVNDTAMANICHLCQHPDRTVYIF